MVPNNITQIVLVSINDLFAKYHYVTLSIQFEHTVEEFQILLCITNNSIKHQSFVYTLLNGQTVLLLTIQFNISHLFEHSLNVNQFYLTQR